ncbi:MAG: hypothetical protein NTW27_10970 [Deltaproteobacteria bacterium]|nr:hypothetical protein [Deltaproteobacteria bacterium]
MSVGKSTILDLKDFICGNSFYFLMLIAVLTWSTFSPLATNVVEAAKGDTRLGTQSSVGDITSDALPSRELSPEERIEKIEEALNSIKQTGEKSEERSYFNKMIGLELIGYVKLMVIVLIIIAVVFPLTIWLMSRRRLLGLSGLATEVTAALLLIGERQAKLANILKEIQGEIDYMETLHAPDLRKLIDQAEKYLKQNERDLERAGSKSNMRDLD